MENPFDITNKRYELYKLNHDILVTKILPLVSNDDLRMKISYLFRIKYCEFYLGTPIWYHEYQWKKEVEKELERINREHGVHMFDE